MKSESNATPQSFTDSPLLFLGLFSITKPKMTVKNENVDKEKVLEQFLRIGLDERTARNTIANHKLTANLNAVIHEAGVLDGCDRAVGNLLYAVATKYPANALIHRPILLQYVTSNKVKMLAQLEAAFSFFSAAGQEAIKLNEFEDACGVGVEVSVKEIEQTVNEVFEELKKESLEQRYRTNGYFAVDKDSTPEKLVFNRTVMLRDSYKNSKRKRLVRLKCCVQNYDWGFIGCNSQVARLFSLNSGSCSADPEEFYAEFWIGTHKSGPSFVVFGREINAAVFGSKVVSLKDWISVDPGVVLGDKVARKWGGDLPFLFKVLSVEKALSIQAHPDKNLARALHEAQPSIYKDANHKPEMALALTGFEALCGFISSKELKGVLSSVPEIVELVQGADAEKFSHDREQDGKEKVNPLFESLFSQIMSSNKGIVREAICKLKRRLCLEKKKRQLSAKEQLVLRLEDQYPADVGVLAAFFLNYVKLKPGEALYLGPNEPHAYISGECIECMATSDNVVRAGLTSKKRDVQALLSMLNYKQGFPEILQGVPLNEYTRKYAPPFDEFEVDRCILPQAASVSFPSVPGPSLFLVMSGKGTIVTGYSEESTFQEGEVLFVPAYMEVSITAAASELHMYRAGVNNRFFGDL